MCVCVLNSYSDVCLFIWNEGNRHQKCKISYVTTNIPINLQISKARETERNRREEKIYRQWTEKLCGMSNGWGGKCYSVIALREWKLIIQRMDRTIF